MRTTQPRKPAAALRTYLRSRYARRQVAPRRQPHDRGSWPVRIFLDLGVVFLFLFFFSGVFFLCFFPLFRGLFVQVPLFVLFFFFSLFRGSLPPGSGLFFFFVPLSPRRVRSNVADGRRRDEYADRRRGIVTAGSGPGRSH